MALSIKPIRNYPFRGKIYTAKQIDEILNGAVLPDYYTKTETDTAIDTALTDYYTKTETDTAIDTAISEIPQPEWIMLKNGDSCGLFCEYIDDVGSNPRRIKLTKNVMINFYNYDTSRGREFDSLFLPKGYIFSGSICGITRSRFGIDIPMGVLMQIFPDTTLTIEEYNSSMRVYKYSYPITENDGVVRLGGTGYIVTQLAYKVTDDLNVFGKSTNVHWQECCLINYSE